MVIPPSPEGNPLTHDLQLMLEDLGYAVTVASTDEEFGQLTMFPTGWGPDYLAPSIFFGLFSCDRGNEFIGFCDHGLDAQIQEALDLQVTDPAEAFSAWAEVDRQVVDLGLWAPMYNGGGDFVSARVGNYQFSPLGWALFDQMWVQEEPASTTSASPVPTQTAAPTPGSPSPLDGTWATGETTCSERTAAAQAAGFAADEMTLVGWSPTCSHGMFIGRQFTLIFEASRLLIFVDGVLGWDGPYRIVDENTFEAGDGYYITYDYAIDGDRLKIDMTRDDCPECAPGADLDGERIVQTVIYESAPFTSQP